MDTTLDDDDEENNNGNESSINCATHDESDGVTDMDGGTTEPPVSKTSIPPSHKDSTKESTSMDGGTHVPANETTSHPDSQTDFPMTEHLLDSSTGAPMDGVTTNPAKIPEPSTSNQKILTTVGTIAECVTDTNNEQSSANDHAESYVHESTTNTTNMMESENSVNDTPMPNQNSILGGVTNEKTDSNTENSLPNELSRPMSDENSPLDGVTTEEINSNCGNNSSRDLPTETSISEIVNNNDFPEKALLLDGATPTSNITEQSLTLPDLVDTRTTDVSDGLPDKTLTSKTPTERLLDAFGSPIPSELEDNLITPSQEYHTTEDEDDAIDGLLALSAQPSKMNQSEKKIDAEKGANNNKPNKDKTNKEKRRSKNNKNNKHNKKKANSEATKQIEEQLKEMNIAERKSRRSQEKSKTPKNKETERKTKRKRRDESSSSPGSPPGVFKLTHHRLRRKENKEKSYKCGQ